MPYDERLTKRQVRIGMRVLMFVSNAFVSDPRVYNESASLLKAGHEVTVIAWDRENQNPPMQDWDGIEVVRLSTRFSIKYGFASWLRNGFTLLLWQRQARRRALKLDREKHFDVIHCHDFDTLRIGLRLRRKLGLPLIYDAHEIFGYMVAEIVPHWTVNVFLWLEKRLMKRVDTVITDGEGRKRYFTGVTDKPVTAIMNCKPLQSPEYQPSKNEDLALLYIGSLHQGRALPMLVRAVKELPGVRCLIGGIGQPGYVQTLKEECAKTRNVTFLGKVPFEEVIPMTRKADAVICVIDPDAVNNRLGMPNKLSEAMVCGRPTICAKGTYSGEITEQEEAGLVVEYSEQALREAIVRLRDDPELRERLGRNALKAAINKYNWQKQEEKLLELYKSLQT